MKLILTAAVDKLGMAGDVVEVKDGYGRNFLIHAASPSAGLAAARSRLLVSSAAATRVRSAA